MAQLPDPEPLGEESHRTKGLLRLTMACNERCPFCNVPQEDYLRKTPPEAQTQAEVQAFVDAGSDTMTISGGEPTLLRKRLVRAIRQAKAGGIRFVELQTNAVLIDEDYAAELAEAGLTSAFVSLLSHIPEHHDALAGLQGAFPRCLRGIDAMLTHGIRVTLNPVTARRTQDLVDDYIDFVAERLPGVGFVSMSAVQPHGRARDLAHELMPDYDVLRLSIGRARSRAAAHGIELVNPYCGLPLCVGWDDDPSRSVEAFEAEHGGWTRTPGVNNVGNKAHGEPCRRCAVRTRCGGAWHAYWTVRGGAGIRPPWVTVEPWLDGATAAAGQVVHHGGEVPDHGDTPTVWWWTRRLVAGDGGRIAASPVTDVALELDGLDPGSWRGPLAVVRRLVTAGQGWLPQARVRIVVGIRPAKATNPDAVARLLSLVLAVGVDGARVLSAAPRWRRVVREVAAQHPTADVTAIQARSWD